MTRPRNFDEHLQLHMAFAVAVSSFDEATWSRIRSRCVSFQAESVLAAFERARLRAIPCGFPSSRSPADVPLSFKVFTGALAGGLAVFQTGIWFGFELSQLVPGMRESAMPARHKSTGKPRVDQHLDAHRLVDTALDSLAGPALGVRAAIQAAGAAVMYHDFLSDDDFVRSFRVVAPEISFADLEHRAIML